MNNFNLIAPVYDRLARLVFGGQILESQVSFLSTIKPTDKVLLIGGGTGELLPLFPPCAGIDYVEKSSWMIRMAKSRQVVSRIEFIHRDFFDLEVTNPYDVIICPYFLDCFSKRNLIEAIRLTKDHLNPGGQLIVTDFQSGRGRWLMKFMHVFFRTFALLESSKLKNIHHLITQCGYQAKNEEFFHKNLIFSRVYRNL